MNLASNLYLLVGTLLMAGCWAIAWFGVSVVPTRSEVVPVSVRENPASFRPSYILWTGWRPIPVSSSNGGGGFGFGK